MKAQNNYLINGLLRIGFLLLLLIITSYKSAEDSKKETIPVSRELKVSEFKFNPGPVVVNVALRRITIEVIGI